MKRMIPIVDLATGAITDRLSSTPTFDVPEDFDRSVVAAEVDARSRVQYRSVNGKSVVSSAFPRPLSWRVHGEECFVCDEHRAGLPEQTRTYTLSAVE
jgi:hypothetical protein